MHFESMRTQLTVFGVFIVLDWVFRGVIQHSNVMDNGVAGVVGVIKPSVPKSINVDITYCV